MAKVIEILNGMMGSGKTNKIIEWMNNNPKNKYIYISPLLSEVDERSRLYSENCKIEFRCPSIDTENGVMSKSDDLLNLLKLGKNISATHSLYLSMTSEHIDEIEKQGYVVIIDEEVGVIDSFDLYSADDLTYLIDNGDVHISEDDGMITWVGKDLGNNNKYKRFVNLCNTKTLYTTKRFDKMMVTQLPIRLFTCAERVIIMTYLFDGNILDCFLKLKGLETKPFTEVVPNNIDKAVLRDLITLVPPSKETLTVRQSATGYSKQSQAECDIISNYIRNVARKYKATSYDVMYTFPKELLNPSRKNGKKIKPKSFIEYKIPKTDDNGNNTYDDDGAMLYETSPCWLYAGCRATNIYSFKWCLIHAFDVYPNVPVESYLADYKHAPSRNIVSLSQITQWVWRSRIRKLQPIVLAISNKHMYDVFKTWLHNDDSKLEELLCKKSKEVN